MSSDFLRAYELKNIEKVAKLHTGVHAKSGLTRQSTTIDNVSDLYSFVKQYDKKFIAGKPVNKEFINEDGTPKPMTITSKHLKDIVHEKIDGVIKYHGISKEKIINAVEQLETPALVIKSPLKKDVLVVFTTETDADNIPIAIYISKNGRAILYATDGNIKKVGSAKVNSLKIKGSRQNSDFLDIIPQSNAGSQADIENNPQSENSYSINEDGGMDSLYADVIRENQNLRWIFSQYDDIYSSRRLDISLNQDDIDRVARTTLKKYSSKYDVKELSEKLTAVYDYLEQTAGRGQVDS